VQSFVVSYVTLVRNPLAVHFMSSAPHLQLYHYDPANKK